MNGMAVVFLLLSIALVWGGLAASAVFLIRRPELTNYPPGGVDDHQEDDAPVERDT